MKLVSLFSYRPALAIALALWLPFVALAQQIWPVQLSGAMIPPRSLDLGVYATDRPQDLFFNATFNDPVDATIQVRLDLSIERNGEVIYRTDPNFAAPPITLDQFQMLTIDGSVLAPYLRLEALVGAGGMGMGSVEVHSGFNQICLQVIGVEREVPISQKFCIQGSFELNQVPQPILPTPNSYVPVGPVQNYTFTWAPMHIGSSNSPAPVEYELELVQLPTGTNNINDAFESALRIYSATTMSSTLIYGPAEPQLQPDVLYAWRVRAYSMLHPTSKLFQNDGYSEIVGFQLYNGDTPPTTPGGESALNIPTECEVYTAAAPPIENTTPVATLDVDSEIQLGYFTLKVTEVTSSGTTHSGRGTVAFPMLNTRVAVEFSNLQVNDQGRVIATNPIEAAVAPEFNVFPQTIVPASINDVINEAYVNSLQTYHTIGLGLNKLVSVLNPTDETPTELPIGMDGIGQPTVAVVGIVFTEREAMLSLVTWQTTGADPLRFAATNVRATPFGIKNETYLQLLTDPTSTATYLGDITPAYQRTSLPESLTRVFCDCTGFKGVESPRGVRLNPELIVAADTPTDPIILVAAPTVEDPETYLGPIDDLPEFIWQAEPDFRITGGDTWLDLSTAARLPDEAFSATAYPQATLPGWRGMIVRDATLELPGSYDLSGGNDPVPLVAEAIYINENIPFRASFAVADLVPSTPVANTAWTYSVDSLTMELTEGQLLDPRAIGGVGIPLFVDPFRYAGRILENNTGEIALTVGLPTTAQSMRPWPFEFSVAPTSTVTGTLREETGGRLLVPTASLSGELSLTAADDEIVAKLVDYTPAMLNSIKSELGIQSFKIDLTGLRLNDLDLDPLAEEPYQLGGSDLQQAVLKIDDEAVSLSEVELLYEPFGNGNPERLGMKFSTLVNGLSLKMTFWGLRGADQFVFEKIELESSTLECDCVATALLPPTDESTGAILDRVIDAEYAHLFVAPNAVGGNSATDSKTVGWRALLREQLRAELRANMRAGFPMLDDETVVIPFLNKKLTVEPDGSGGLVAKQRMQVSETTRFAALATVPEQQLPLDITEELEKLGMPSSNLPEHARLFITAFRLPDENAASWQSAELELTLMYQLYDNGPGEFSYLAFSQDDIPVGPQSINLSNPKLALQWAQVHGDNDEILYITGNALTPGTELSYALIDCDQGFGHFFVHGQYVAPHDNEAGSQVTKILHLVDDPIRTANEAGDIKLFGSAAARFPFLLATDEMESHSLRHFITPIRKVMAYEEPEADEAAGDGAAATATGQAKEWSFSVYGAEQLVFKPHPDEEFGAYLDFDDEATLDGVTLEGNSTLAGTDRTFMGLVFDRIQFELRGFRTNAGGDNLTFPIEDLTFRLDQGADMADKFTLQDAVTKAQDYKLGGWKYELKELEFYIHNGAMEPNRINEEGVYLFGSTLIPIFEADPPNDDDFQFDSGWVGFEGTVDFDATGDKYEPDCNLRVNAISGKVFHSAFVPTLGMRLSMGSAVWLAWNDGNGEFEPMANLSGGAGIYLVPAVTEKVWPGAPDIAKSIEFVFDALRFSNLQINSPDIYTSCSGTVAAGGIKSIDFGRWGIIDPTMEDDWADMAGNPDIRNGENQTFNNIYGNPAGNTSGTGGTSGTSGTGGTSGAGGDGGGGDTGGNSSSASKMQKFKKGLQGFPIQLSTPRFACISDEEYRLDLGIMINVMSDFLGGEEAVADAAAGAGDEGAGGNDSGGADTDGGSNNDGGSNTDGGGNNDGGSNTDGGGNNDGGGGTRLGGAAGGAAGAGVAGRPKPVQQGTEYNTAGLKAQLQMGWIFKLDKDDGTLSPSHLQFGCAQLEGAFGPVIIKGGLNWLTDNDYDSKWGKGFKYYGDITIGKMRGFNFKSVGQFANTQHRSENGNNYRYFFVDLEATIQPGINIPKTTLFVNGFLGGFRYNMARANINTEYVFNEPDENHQPVDNNDNDNCTLPEGSDLLAAGVSLSGEEYEPVEGFYGGNFSLILSNVDPKLMVGDLGLDIAMTDRNGQSLTFEEITIKGNVYVSPDDIATRRESFAMLAKADLGYNFSNKVLYGYFGLKAGFPKELPILKIPASVSSKEFAEGHLKIDFNDGRWGVKFGSWGDPTGQSGYDPPTSELEYLTSEVSIPGLNAGVTTYFYMQMGHDVDGMPPIGAIVPNWDELGTEVGGRQERQTGQLELGNGIILGMKRHFEISPPPLGPLRLEMYAGFGFDLSLVRYPPGLCGMGPDERIGINGWYAQGQAYAYAKARLDLEYDLWFDSGVVNIADMSAAVVLQAKFPNPSYFKAHIRARYSVLGGMLKGTANYKLELGDQCEGLEPQSPIADIKIFADAAPQNGEEDVNIFTKLQIATNMPVREMLTFPKYDNETGEFLGDMRFRPVNEYVRVFPVDNRGNQTGDYVPAVMTRQPDGYGLTLKFSRILEGEQRYAVSYSFLFEEDHDDNGTWVPAMVKRTGSTTAEEARETDTFYFTTGPYPDDIVTEMLASQAPGYRQRYWHKDYATPLLRFLDSDTCFTSLFPQTSEINGEDVRNEFLIELIGYDDAGEASDRSTFLVDAYPNSTTFRQAFREEISVRGLYKIPTIRTEQRPAREVLFSGLNEMELRQGALYTIRLIRRPRREFFVSETSETTGENGQIITSRTLDNAVLDAFAENTKILYEFEFATSKYSSLGEKLAASSVSFVPSIEPRNDFNHPLEQNTEFPIGRNENHASRDEYFAFTNPVENFDVFDLDRLRLNTSVDYRDPYGAAYTIKEDRYGGHSIHPSLVEYINHAYRGAKKNYLLKVMEESSAFDRNYEGSDGTGWNYNFYLPPNYENEGRINYLSQDEVDDKQLNPVETPGSDKDGSYLTPVFDGEIGYGLLFQDLRARIVLNQMRWLAHFGQNIPAGGRYLQYNVTGLLASMNGQYPIVGSVEATVQSLNELLEPTFNIHRSAGHSPSLTYTVHQPPYSIDAENWNRDNYPEGEFFKWGYNNTNATGGGSDYSWLLPAALQSDPAVFVADEYGYRYNYHGKIQLTFNNSDRWIEMREQLGSGTGKQNIFTVQPNHISTGTTVSEFATSVEQLRPDYFYRIKQGSNVIYMGNNSFTLHQKFAFEKIQNNDGKQIYTVFSPYYNAFLDTENWGEDRNGRSKKWHFEEQGTTNTFTMLNLGFDERNWLEKGWDAFAGGVVAGAEAVGEGFVTGANYVGNGVKSFGSALGLMVVPSMLPYRILKDGEYFPTKRPDSVKPNRSYADPAPVTFERIEHPVSENLLYELINDQGGHIRYLQFVRYGRYYQILDERGSSYGYESYNYTNNSRPVTKQLGTGRPDNKYLWDISAHTTDPNKVVILNYANGKMADFNYLDTGVDGLPFNGKPLANADRSSGSNHSVHKLRVARTLENRVNTNEAISGQNIDSKQNLAHHGPVTFSSEVNSNRRSLVVDGNREGDNVYSTLESQPWVSIDLGAVMDIGRVEAFKKFGSRGGFINMDHYDHRNYVIISQTPMDGFTLDQVKSFSSGQFNVWISEERNDNGKTHWVHEVPEGVKGRYVRIQMATEGILGFKEIEVYSPGPKEVPPTLLVGGANEKLYLINLFGKFAAPRAAYILLRNGETRTPLAAWDGKHRVFFDVEASGNIGSIGSDIVFPKAEPSGGASNMLDLAAAWDLNRLIPDNNPHLEVYLLDEEGVFHRSTNRRGDINSVTAFTEVPYAEALNNLQSYFAGYSAPYEGIIKPIPGTINATAYDFGGPGVGYRDADLRNQTNGLRVREGVDIVETQGQFVVTELENNEWLAYSIQIQQAGFYDFNVTYASAAAHDIQLYHNGRDLGRFTLPGTGNTLTNYSVVLQGFLEANPGRPHDQLRLVSRSGGSGLRLHDLQLETREDEDADPNDNVAVRNVALGKPVTASGVTPGKDPAKITDGNTTGTWLNNQAFVSNRSTGAWVTIDLGQPYYVEEVMIHNVRTPDNPDRWGSYFLLLDSQPFSASTSLAAARGAADWVSSDRNDNGKNDWRIPVDHDRPVRYVRLQYDDDYADYLNMNEVQVFGRPLLSNVARSATVKASSVATGSTAAVIDNMTDGNFGRTPGFSTTAENGAWIELDLGTVREIEAVQIWNRTDAEVSNWGNYRVMVSERPFPLSGATGSTVSGIAWASEPLSEELMMQWLVDVPSLTVGRYVRIQQASDYAPSLNVAEVQVWGAPIPATATPSPVPRVTDRDLVDATTSVTFADPSATATAIVDEVTSGGATLITESLAGNWLALDLGDEFVLDSVQLFFPPSAPGWGAYRVAVSTEPFPETGAVPEGTWTTDWRNDAGAAFAEIALGGRFARYVLVQYAADYAAPIALDEIFVIGELPTSLNLALNKIASSSSHVPGYDPGYVNDNRTTGDYYDRPGLETEAGGGAWVTIDLQRPCRITSIELFGRAADTDENGAVTTGYELGDYQVILLSDNPTPEEGEEIGVETAVETWTTSDQHAAGVDNWTVVPPPATLARYVRIQLTQDNVRALNLAEIKIMGFDPAGNVPAR